MKVHADFITDLEVALWFLGWHARDVRLIWRRSQCILHAPLHRQKSTSETFRMRRILNLGPVGMPSISPTRCRYLRIKNSGGGPLVHRAAWIPQCLVRNGHQMNRTGDLSASSSYPLLRGPPFGSQKNTVVPAFLVDIVYTQFAPIESRLSLGQ